MGVDVLIITAYEDELSAVRQVDTAALPPKWVNKVDGSGLRYYYCDFEREDQGVLSIAAAWALNPGAVATGGRASSLVNELKPTCLSMCGVCSGRRNKVFIGDLIVANLVYKYDAGAINTFYDSTGKNVSTMLPEITTYLLQPDWKSVLSDFADSWLEKSKLQRPPSIESQLRWLLRKLHSSSSSPWNDHERQAQCPNWTRVLKEARDRKLIKSTSPKPVLTERGKKFVEREKYEYPDGYQDPSQKVHSGPIGSGAKVVVDENIFEALQKNEREVLALDREANAIGYAAFQTDIKYMLMVKGVQDYADVDQDDMFKEFACQASAEFLIDFLCHHATVDETRESVNLSSNQGGNHQVIAFSRMPYQPDDYIKHVEWGVIDLLKKGLPIIVEGLPGSGKTWLIREVSERLRQSPDPYCIWNLNLDFLAKEEKDKANFKLKDFTKWMVGELGGICEGCDEKIASLWDRHL